MNSNSDQTINSIYQELTEKIVALEQRIIQLELNKRPGTVHPLKQKEESPVEVTESMSDAQIESSIGQYGLAWIGNFVLFFGISFLAEYLRVSGFNLVSSLFGFIAVGSIFFLAKYLKDSDPYMAMIFNWNGYLLGFYVIMKLHFFAANPLIVNKFIVIFLLLVLTGYLMYLAIKKGIPVYAGISMFFVAITAMISDDTHLTLFLSSMISLAGMAFLYRFGWIRLVFWAIILTYLVNLLWLLNNPVMGHHFQIIENHQFGFVYLFLITAVFSLIALMPVNEQSYTSNGIVGTIIFNGLGFLFLLSLHILSFFRDNYVLPTSVIAVYCITYSILLKVRSNWKFTASLYAIFGYLALTAYIYGYYHFPKAYFFLALQSFLVVSMAIWFRSKFLVIMNSLMYISLLLIYVTTADHGDAMNISFSFVALATARILNLKQERLTIKTELIRNFYLLCAFPMVLYTFYHLVPGQFITLSWVLAAVAYFIISLIFRIVKYRYMALGTMIAATLFLFLVDLARIELVYRVIALLSLAVISLALSSYYSKKLKSKAQE